MAFSTTFQLVAAVFLLADMVALGQYHDVFLVAVCVLSGDGGSVGGPIVLRQPAAPAASSYGLSLLRIVHCPCPIRFQHRSVVMSDTSPF